MEKNMERGLAGFTLIKLKRAPFFSVDFQGKFWYDEYKFICTVLI
jgi:hypothetical protein